MAPFSIPAPAIIPLRLPVFGGSKSIDTDTKIQLFCETYLEHEIFFTLDGTKPQPYAGIVQGSKLFKYCSSFCLPPGKITIKAVAVNKNVHTMRSSVVTKTFEVLKIDSPSNNKQNSKGKEIKKPKIKKKSDSSENERNKSKMVNSQDGQKSEAEIHRVNPDAKKDEDILDCFDQAFIGGSEFDTENSDLEGSIEEEISLLINKDLTNMNSCFSGDTDDLRLYAGEDESDSVAETVEEVLLLGKNMGEPNATVTTDTAISSNDTQFCCLKCDLTLQQCISCNKMNGVSSKFCIGCGKQLSRLCSICGEYNPCVAAFCQYCGSKLTSAAVMLDCLRKTDHSIMAKPESKDAAIQLLNPVTATGTQTITDKNTDKNSVKKSPIKKSPDVKRRPHHSPGRGYWHQQLDYICNNLKSHAYNNVEFRNEISEPVLCGFKSADITKEEDNITVTIVFSPLKNKNDHGVPDALETESKQKEDKDT